MHSKQIVAHARRLHFSGVRDSFGHAQLKPGARSYVPSLPKIAGPLQVGMATGATIHTANGEPMYVRRREHTKTQADNAQVAGAVTT